MRHIVSLSALMFLMAGCFSGHTERVQDVYPYRWTPSDTVWVEWPNEDTLSLRNLSVIVLFNNDFKEDLVEVRITTITPDSLRFTETVPLNLAATGIRRNDHFESAVPYRVKSRLSRPGIYRFGFAPAEEYSGITAIGIKTD